MRPASGWRSSSAARPGRAQPALPPAQAVTAPPPMGETLVRDQPDAPGEVPAVVKPLLRGWSHVVSFVVVLILSLLLMALTSAARGGRLVLALYFFGLLAMFG